MGAEAHTQGRWALGVRNQLWFPHLSPPAHSPGAQQPPESHTCSAEGAVLVCGDTRLLLHQLAQACALPARTGMSLGAPNLPNLSAEPLRTGPAMLQVEVCPAGLRAALGVEREGGLMCRGPERSGNMRLHRLSQRMGFTHRSGLSEPGREECVPDWAIWISSTSSIEL